MSNQKAKFLISESLEELELTIKGFHCITSLLSVVNEQYLVDIDNLTALLDKYGLEFQRNITGLKTGVAMLS